MLDWLNWLRELPDISHIVIEELGFRDYQDERNPNITIYRNWGFAMEGEHTLAAYFVEWPREYLGETMVFIDLVVGKWGEKGRPSDRQLCSLRYRKRANGAGEFMAIDADSTMPSDLATLALKREDVIGKPRSRLIFRIADAVLYNAPSLLHIRQWGNISR